MTTRNKYFKEYFKIFIIFLISFSIRLYMTSYETYIGVDSIWYVKSAEKLMAGKIIEGTSLTYPPFYPILISISSLIFRNIELAARLVSVFFGSFVILPIYLLSKRLYDEKVAFITMLLVAFHPILIKWSTLILSEITFSFFVVLGIYLGWVALEEGKRGYFAFSGVLFGLSFLIRQEALFHFLILLGWLWVLYPLFSRRRYNLKEIVIGGLFLILAFFIIISPFIYVVYITTGKLSLGSKGIIPFYKYSGGGGTKFLYGLSEDKTYTVAQKVFAEGGKLDFGLPSAFEIIRVRGNAVFRRWVLMFRRELFKVLPFAVTPVMLFVIPFAFFRRLCLKDLRNFTYLGSFIVLFFVVSFCISKSQVSDADGTDNSHFIWYGCEKHHRFSNKSIQQYNV